MTVKTSFAHDDFVSILAEYDLGTYVDAEGVRQGTVQTNYFLHTTRGRYFFRCYENRSVESVLFESDLVRYLSTHDYPCPAPIENRQGQAVGMAQNKPYMLFEFRRGAHVVDPTAHQWQQLIQKAAWLHKLTRNFHSPYTGYRWNYSPDLCRRLALAEARRINTADAYAKYEWLSDELSTLALPAELPMGICHCDFHFSNVLFQGDRFSALLDFDDANHTYLLFDLIGLVEYQAWPFTAGALDVSRARTVVQAYAQHRPLSLIEQRHLFDVYRFSILFDCVWYFDRGSVDNFYERRKIDALHQVGRERLFIDLFR